MHNSGASCQSYMHTYFPTCTHDSVLLLGGLGQSTGIKSTYTHVRAMHIRDVGQQKTSEEKKKVSLPESSCVCARARVRARANACVCA